MQRPKAAAPSPPEWEGSEDDRQGPVEMIRPNCLMYKKGKADAPSRCPRSVEGRRTGARRVHLETVDGSLKADCDHATAE